MIDESTKTIPAMKNEAAVKNQKLMATVNHPLEGTNVYSTRRTVRIHHVFID